MENEVSYDLVRELFSYNPVSGGLVWKVHRKGRKGRIGEQVGCVNTLGYRSVMINLKSYYVHRLVWLYHHGYLPENKIDHINRDKSDNRVENLREVSQQCNIRNASTRKDNVSGIKGVYPNKLTGKWEVSIRGVYVRIFDDFIEAVAHRLAEEQALNWEGCDATSAAYLFIRGYVERV